VPPFLDHTEVMGRALVLLVLFGALALPASAAEVNPALLVLHKADLPYGFQADADDTFVQTNASAARGADARTRALLRRSGRITGYQADYDFGDTTIRSRADVFRKPAGAKLVLAAAATAFDASGIRGMHRSPLRIGTEGWVYGQRSGSNTLNYVVWQYDRIFAGVAAWGVTKARTIAMARTQQRRIAVALR
jgi:hypothetical protein